MWRDCFDLALSQTLENEGVGSDDPHDPGGLTRYGICKSAHPGLDIANLTVETARRIYQTEYWKAGGADRILSFDIACKHFDLCVNLWVPTACRLLQRACNSLGAELKEDGLAGPKTLGAVNRYPHPEALLMAYRIMAGRYYLELGKPLYIAGWLARLAR
jgi:lysozyme family protein